MQKTEVVGVRLDPKLKYLAELGARIQRRTLSSYIEWAVQASLGYVYPPNSNKSLMDMSETLWHVSEKARLVKLGIYYPSLLTFEEQVVWDAALLIGAITKEVSDAEEVLIDYDADKLHAAWEDLWKYAKNEMTIEDLKAKHMPAPF